MVRALQLLALVFLFIGCSAPADKPAEPRPKQKTPTAQLTNYDLERLVALRTAIKAGEQAKLAALEELVKQADECMNDPIYSVMQKTIMPPSGNQHDYISLAPYWWPDPAKPDGLPWVRKDGEVNPETKDSSTDDQAKDRAFRNIETLALAAFLSGEEKYAKRSVEQINTWFLDPSTRMNPNLNYAQGIPGLNDGRCFGIIEFTRIQGVVGALELLEHEGMLPAATKTGMDDWVTEMLDWFQTSELGIEEGLRKNNHATWYEVQVVCMLRYLGRAEEARKVLETIKAKIIATQIEPDGSQPHELARTKSLSYSRMNLKGMTRLAWHGKQLDVDLWNYISEDGASIPQAYEFLRPYAFADKPWPYQQLGDLDHYWEDVREMFYRTGAMMEVAEFCALRPDGLKPEKNIDQLIFYCP